jgi:hypothetical protein
VGSLLYVREAASRAWAQRFGKKAKSAAFCCAALRAGRGPRDFCRATSKFVAPGVAQSRAGDGTGGFLLDTALNLFRIHVVRSDNQWFMA